MDDYPKYPIYHGWACYHRELMNYDLSHGTLDAARTDGLPSFRIRDHTSFIEWMYPVDPGEAAVLQRTKAAFENMVANPQGSRSPDFAPVDPQDIEYKAKLVGEEEWHLVWFCHETVDVGQTNKEVLESFRAFLDRKGVRDEEYYRPTPGAYCAMGAENRWRWRGEKDGDPPPCRCDGCKKSGMIRIIH